MRSRFIWKESNKKIQEIQNLSIMQEIPPYLYQGSRFYITYYICPCCGEMLLYKTNTVGDFTVLTDFEKADVTSVFTCAGCRSFYASRPSYKLADGNGFKIERLTEDSYVSLLKDVESVGIVG